MSLSIIIITKNEEAQIKDCLESVRFADEIILVDSGSTDKTLSIARAYATRIIETDWKGYSGTKMIALEAATGDWILWLDADERVQPSLQEEIQEVTKTGAVAGYYIARKAIFLGRWIKHCGWYPGYVIRLFKKEGARFSENLVHESVYIDGPAAHLKSPLIHYTDTSLDHYFIKFNKYTTLAARELFQSNYSCHLTDLIGRPIYSFIKMYIIKRGFLDGVQGLILCILSACYVFTKYAKLWHYREQNKTKE